jgi:hypothetical protein
MIPEAKLGRSPKIGLPLNKPHGRVLLRIKNRQII